MEGEVEGKIKEDKSAKTECVEPDQAADGDDEGEDEEGM